MVCHVSLGEGVFQGVSQDCPLVGVFKGDPRILLSFICAPGLLFLGTLQMVFREGSQDTLISCKISGSLLGVLAQRIQHDGPS